MDLRRLIVHQKGNLNYFSLVFSFKLIQQHLIIHTFFMDLLDLVEPIDTVKWFCFACRIGRCLGTNSSVILLFQLCCLSCVFFFLLLLPLFFTAYRCYIIFPTHSIKTYAQLFLFLIKRTSPKSIVSRH